MHRYLRLHSPWYCHGIVSPWWSSHFAKHHFTGTCCSGGGDSHHLWELLGEEDVNVLLLHMWWQFTELDALSHFPSASLFTILNILLRWQYWSLLLSHSMVNPDVVPVGHYHLTIVGTKVYLWLIVQMRSHVAIIAHPWEITTEEASLLLFDEFILYHVRIL